MNPIHSLCTCLFLKYCMALLAMAVAGVCGLFLVAGVAAGVGVVQADELVTCKVAPLAKTPENKVGDASPTFTWQALEDCTSYQLYLSNDEGILSITWVTSEEASCTGGKGNCTFKPATALPEDDYGWWIRGWQPGKGTSKWSAGTPFTVDLEVCAKNPQPVAPVDVTEPGLIEYQWLGVYGCEWYQLSVSGPSGNVLSVWVNADDIGCIYDSVCRYSPLEALPTGDYFWWMRGWSRGTQIGQWTSATPFFIAE